MRTTTFLGESHRKEVNLMRLVRFIEAVGASVAGYYVCKAIDFVVTLLSN